MNYSANLNYAEAVAVKGDREIRLVKPLTFMNLSGKAVAELDEKYGVETTDTYVIYDDVDIDMGSIRIRKKGGAGTHNGMRSIISCLGSEEFPRIRVGVKSDIAERYDSLADFVLGPLEGEELDILMRGVESAGDALLDLTNESIDIVMNNYNRKIKSVGDEAPVEPIPCSL